MKVIFLDVDGVLNGWEWKRNPSVPWPKREVDPACVERLNRLTDATGAGLVLSSSWRSTVSHAMELYWAWGIKGLSLGVTRSLMYLPDQPHYRGAEILDWLKRHRRIESFVILDDDDDMGELLPHLVQTNPGIGLQDPDVERALAILGRES